MFDLKPLSEEAIPPALDKAVRYRLLNEPMQAESICLDILAIEPDNQEALINLVLALSDQFPQRLQSAFKEATEILPQLTDQYHRSYYEGILAERRANVHLQQGTPGCGHLAHHWFEQAMSQYEKATEIRPSGIDDPILRWNTCVRSIARHPEVKPEPEDSFHPLLE